MSAAIQKLPNGRHIVSFLGDPGPVPGEEDITEGERSVLSGSADPLVLRLKAFWAEQVALLHHRIDEAESLDDLDAISLTLRIAIEQWRAICERAA